VEACCSEAEKGDEGEGMMDTSPEYVKMCDCDEIRETWEPSLGDWCKPDNFDIPQVICGIEYMYRPVYLDSPHGNAELRDCT